MAAKSLNLVAEMQGLGGGSAASAAPAIGDDAATQVITETFFNAEKHLTTLDPVEPGPAHTLEKRPDFVVGGFATGAMEDLLVKKPGEKFMAVLHGLHVASAKSKFWVAKVLLFLDGSKGFSTPSVQECMDYRATVLERHPDFKIIGWARCCHDASVCEEDLVFQADFQLVDPEVIGIVFGGGSRIDFFQVDDSVQPVAQKPVKVKLETRGAHARGRVLHTNAVTDPIHELDKCLDRLTSMEWLLASKAALAKKR
ncbi:unnamed protein product, partial [Prorocentrum cordatum]